MIESMFERTAQWLDASGADPAIVLYTQCRVVRNLADYPFPKQCTPEEKKTVEGNVLSVLTNMNFLSDGRYYTLPDIDETEAYFLRERELISQRLIESTGPRGVYVREDQSLSISINDADHVSLIGIASGQQLSELWNSTSLTDDTLAGILDFAFEDRRGYLTSRLADIGTGLTLSAVLHLPGLTMTNAISQYVNMTDKHTGGYQIVHAYPNNAQASGDLYRISSIGTLGRSEMEILYHFTQTVDEFVGLEQSAQKLIADTDALQLEDRIERALGLARNARLLAFDEGLGVLSSLRLGVSTGLLKEYTLDTLNEMSIIAQDAHVQLNYGESCDSTICKTHRAQLFRNCFAEHNLD